MIDLNILQNTKLIEKPFKYLHTLQVLSDIAVNNLVVNMPTTNYFRSLRKEGSDKTYDVMNNSNSPATLGLAKNVRF